VKQVMPWFTNSRLTLHPIFFSSVHIFLPRESTREPSVCCLPSGHRLEGDNPVCRAGTIENLSHRTKPRGPPSNPTERKICEERIRKGHVTTSDWQQISSPVTDVDVTGIQD
jgi:hypothetical protein